MRQNLFHLEIKCAQTRTQRHKHITKEKSKSKNAWKDEETESSPGQLSLALTTDCCTLLTEQPSTTRLAPPFSHLSPCISVLEVVLPLTLYIFAVSYSSSLIGQLRFSSINPSTTPHTAPTQPPLPPPGPCSPPFRSATRSLLHALQPQMLLGGGLWRKNRKLWSGSSSSTLERAARTSDLPSFLLSFSDYRELLIYHWHAPALRY